MECNVGDLIISKPLVILGKSNPYCIIVREIREDDELVIKHSLPMNIQSLHAKYAIEKNNFSIKKIRIFEVLEFNGIVSWLLEDDIKKISDLKEVTNYYNSRYLLKKSEK